MMCSTKIYLVGAGPGDAGLITVKGAQLIGRADVVVYDYLSNTELLAYARPDAELMYVGKKGFAKHIGQDGINQLLVDKAFELDAAYQARLAAVEGDLRAEGDAPKTPVIVRLKGGDPFVFGRGGEEALALEQAGVPFEIVPGVTSGVAAPAYAGIPVTHRRVAASVTFITGNEDPTKAESDIDWNTLAGLAKSGGTLCFYMGMRNLPNICAQLTERGVAPETPAALVQWGTMACQRTLTATLDTVAERAREEGFEAPVMTVVGPVVALRERLQWFENAPLFGRRIVVTRSRTQAGTFSGLLRDLGADVVEIPTIEICDPSSFDVIDAAIERIADYDWLVFTSVNGVDRFFKRLAEPCASAVGGSPRQTRDTRTLAGLRVAAIGPATADALTRHGIMPDAVPGEYRAEAVFDAMRAAGLAAGDKVLIARAKEARETLPEMLAEAGCEATVAPVYETRRPADEQTAELCGRIVNGEVDAVTFTSSSTARNLVAMLGEGAVETLSKLDLFSIGPITTQTLAKLGLTNVHQADTYTIPGLVACVRKAYER
ncbi:uroporphyrinogen-III C-methyltransferase [Slackia heliotrinireducens]|uniref:uroporphyrinogen-III C-methyltransferase n=1 Tax=Slackia heliotrinireducens TaxID=84110 RepID=UPI00331463FD